jgi:hypothetical protein
MHLGPINTPSTLPLKPHFFLPFHLQSPTTSQHQLYSRIQGQRELLPFAIVPLFVTKKKVNQASYRDGEDVHGRQEQDAVEEGEPEVGKPGIQGPEAREPGQGAEGQVLHHAPLCHHADVLQGLGPLICRTGNSDCSFLTDNLDSGSNYLSKKSSFHTCIICVPGFSVIRENKAR